MTRCNVRIEDPHFHELHHALGCPWPDEIMGELRRNHFAADEDSDTVARMRASPHWTDGSRKFGMLYFHVTETGKRALAEHLREHVEIPARYAITYHHYDGCNIVIARNRSAARYAAYVQSDLDCSFMDYAAEIKSVRLHSPAQIPA